MAADGPILRPKSSLQRKFPDLSAGTRLAQAREKTDKIVDHIRNLLEMHEANAIVIYSKTLAGQIPRSYAAHAFAQFEGSMHLFEVIRLCALWDSPKRERISIPTVIELVAYDDVIDEAIGYPAAIVAEAPQSGISWLRGPMPSPMLQEVNRQRREKIADAIKKAREVERSSQLQALRALRDTFIAHNLRPPEPGAPDEAPAPLPRYGDETAILETSIEIAGLLNSGLNRNAFDWDGARQMARSNAEALWKGCRFKVGR